MATRNSLFDDLDDTRLIADEAVSALDELFRASVNYSKSENYLELLEFIRRFPYYSPFNCFLLHVQKPSVSFVATAGQWEKRFGRTIKPDARPLVILAPMCPVLFVFDTADTEGEPLPQLLTDPFATKGVLDPSVWDKTLRNLPRDRIIYVETERVQNKAGSIGRAMPNDFVTVNSVTMRASFRIELNKSQNLASRYATLVHELGHLYSCHLGTPNEKWWPDRRCSDVSKREFEAESISYLVCNRAGISTSSDSYLSGYLSQNRSIPEISLECVLKAAGQIESMGKRQQPPRKEDIKTSKI